MQARKRIVFVAGEESGDKYVAEIVKRLKRSNHSYKLSGIGGQHMESAGVALISNLAQYGVTGLTEVVRQFGIIKKAFKQIKSHLLKVQPDLLVLVDYPGFNLRLARFAKANNIRVLYYISPQIWAWKYDRIHTIRETVDRMAVILPFEKTIYEKEHVPVSFVGHPIIHRIKTFKEALLAAPPALSFPSRKKVIAMLPGSRTHEIKQHMPIFVESAKRLAKSNSNLHFAIPVAKSLRAQLIESYFKDTNLSYDIVEGQALQVAALSDFIVCASGTASLECALLEKPMCIVYKASWFSYLVASQVIRVKYLGLVNLLTNQMTVTELLQYDCNAYDLSKVIQHYLNNPDKAEKLACKLAQVKDILSSNQADTSIEKLIESESCLNAT